MHNITFILSNFPEDKGILSILTFRLFCIIYKKAWTTHIHQLLCSVCIRWYHDVFPRSQLFSRENMKNFILCLQFTNNYKIYTNVMLKWQSKRQNFFNILHYASYKSYSIYIYTLQFLLSSECVYIIRIYFLTFSYVVWKNFNKKNYVVRLVRIISSYYLYIFMLNTLTKHYSCTANIFST